MTKVKIDAGICGFMTKVTAEAAGDDVKLHNCIRLSDSTENG